MKNETWKRIALLGALPAVIALVAPGLALLTQIAILVDLSLRAAPKQQDTIAPPLSGSAIWATLGVLFIASLVPVFLLIPAWGTCKAGEYCATGYMLSSLAVTFFLFGSYLSLKGDIWKRACEYRRNRFAFTPRTTAKVATVFVLLFALLYQQAYWKKSRVVAEVPRPAFPDLDFAILHGLSFLVAVALIHAVRFSRDSEP